MTSKTETRFRYEPDDFIPWGRIITDIQTSEETLDVSQMGEEEVIYGLTLDPDKVLPSVKTLILPSVLLTFKVTRRNFPNLQRLFHLTYSSEEPIEDRDLAVYWETTLIGCLSSQKRFVIPSSVRSLGPFAFRDSPVEEILCERPDLEEIDPQAFLGSAFLAKNPLLVHASTLLYLAGDVNELRLPESIRQIHKNAFIHHVPQKLALHRASCLPEESLPFGGTRSTLYQEVFLQDTEEFLPSARNCSTESFSLPKEDPRYTCVEGVVFSKDRSQLVLYPPCRPDKEYFVPEGTRFLFMKAFQTAPFLESLHLPSSVISCGDSCFESMSSLRSCTLPENLEVISAQLFASCRELKSISFPKGLRSIEEKAFQETALEEITLPEGVTSVGEKAFDDCSLKKVHLPSTLQHLGTRSLWRAREVWAYEGTAKGLLAALHESAFYSIFNNVRVSPSSLVHVLGGEKEKILFFPKDFTRLERDACVEKVWDGDSIDYELLAKCFPDLSFPNKAEVALTLALQEEDPKGEYHQYLRRVAKRAAQHFLSFESEALFSLFAKEIPFSPKTRQDLLDLCNQKGRIREAAYLLDQKGGKIPSRSFTL